MGTRCVINQPGILGPLLDHLSLTDVFRVHRALGRHAAWPDETPRMLSHTSLGLKTPIHTMDDLRRRMAHSHTRCVGCGVRTRREPRVCAACASDRRSPWAMCTRRELRDAVRTSGGARNMERRIRALPVVKRTGGTHALVYWWRDARAALPLS
jgi:hypothetical protein